MAKKGAQMETAEQTIDTAAAPAAVVETPVISLEVEKAKAIEKRYQELLKMSDFPGLTDEQEEEFAELIPQRNKIKRQRGTDIAKVIDIVKYHSVTPEEIFGEAIKTMYAQKIEVKSSSKGTKEKGFELFKIYKSTSIRPSAYCKEYVSYDKETQIKNLSIFELVDTLEEVFEFQLQTPEVKALMEKDGEEIKKAMKKQFAEFKKINPNKKETILYKTKEDKPKPTAA